MSPQQEKNRLGARRRLLVFSDPNANTMYKYAPETGLSVFRYSSGYSGADIADYGQPGSNGLTLDPQGRLTIKEHGNRRVTRLEKDGRVTVLAARTPSTSARAPRSTACDWTFRASGPWQPGINPSWEGLYLCQENRS